jgi:hypothetical protein
MATRPGPPERCGRCGKFLPRLAAQVAVLVSFDFAVDAEDYLLNDQTRARPRYGFRPVLPIPSRETSRVRVCPDHCKREARP